MSNTHLVAQPVVDKNGRHTTVHKKPVTAKSARVLPSVISNADIKARLLSQRVISVKCTSSKHHFMGCNEPECPEGISIPWAEQQVEYSPTHLKELADAGVTNPNFKSMRAYRENHWIQWTVNDRNDPEKYGIIIIPPHRPDTFDAVDAIDKSLVPSFDTTKELVDFVDELYGRQNATVHFNDHRLPSYPEDSQNFYGVGSFYVESDLRGLGVGSHLMRMMTKFADEHDGVLSLAPTEVGDGHIVSLGRNSEEYQNHRREHYKNLLAFYGKYGFVENRARGNGKDLLTGKNVEYDDFYEGVTYEGQRALEWCAMVRYPNGKMPRKMFRSNSAYRAALSG